MHKAPATAASGCPGASEGMAAPTGPPMGAETRMAGMAAPPLVPGTAAPATAPDEDAVASAAFSPRKESELDHG